MRNENFWEGLDFFLAIFVHNIGRDFLSLGTIDKSTVVIHVSHLLFVQTIFYSLE